MSIVQNHGIVLRYYENRKRAVLITEQDFRVDVITERPVMQGSLISYVQLPYAIQPLDTLNVPFNLARYDMLFLHHVLEICIYYVPSGSHISSLYTMLLLLYDSTYYTCSTIVKHYFIARLLLLFGYYPEQKEFLPLIHHFNYSVIDIRLIEAIDLEHQQLLYRWVKQCFVDHPLIANFNTMHFLTNE